MHDRVTICGGVLHNAESPPSRGRIAGKMALGGWSPLGEPVDTLKLKEEWRELMLTPETPFPSIVAGSLVLYRSTSHVAFKNERVCRDSDEQQYRILHEQPNSSSIRSGQVA